MTMITPSYLGETIEYSSLHACRSTLEDPTDPVISVLKGLIDTTLAEIPNTEKLNLIEEGGSGILILRKGDCPCCHHEKLLVCPNPEDPKDESKNICRSCERELRKIGKCPRCGEKKSLSRPDPADKTKHICNKCWREARVGRCPGCDKDKPLTRKDPRGGTEHICDHCWNQAHEGTCPRCGNKRLLTQLDPEDQTRRICPGCLIKS